MLKIYLGDGVYAEQDPGGRIKLTSSNGIVDTNTIYLDDGVLRALQDFIKQLEARDRGRED